MSEDANELQQAKDDFVAEWGAIGSAWGINRTMAQIHALLMVTPQLLSTDEVMQELEISRGNANQNLRELVGWGLIRRVVRKGERREYFEAEKDVWKMFAIIVRERKRREIEPAMEVLGRCQASTKGLKGREAVAFQQQIKALEDFIGLASRVMDRVSTSSESKLIPLAMKLLK